MKTTITRKILVGRVVRQGWLALLVAMLAHSAKAQVSLTLTISLYPSGYTTTAANTTINLTGSYVGNVTINHPNCTVNIGPTSPATAYTYTGLLAVNAAGCTINNNSGSEVSSSGIAINSAATINNNAGAKWTGNLYSGIAVGSTVNNAGTWGTGGQQFSPLNGLTINNTGTWNAISYGVSGNPVTIVNSGSWLQQLGGISTNLTLTNAAGATWSQAVQNYGSGSMALTNSGIWTANIVFPSGTNSFDNRAGATATIGSVTFGGTTTISNGATGGTPTLTFSGGISPTASTSLVNYAGTVNTNAGYNSAGTTDNRATWNASTFASSGTVANSGTLKPTNSYSGTGGTATNTGILDLTTSGASFALGGGSLTNASGGIIKVAANFGTSGSGAVTNNGTITAATYAGSGSLTNNSSFTASTSFANSGGTVTNNAGATIATPTYTNSGTTTNNGTLNPTGDFINNAGISNVVIISSAINPGGNFINQGLTTINGTVRAAGYVLNENSGATLTNNGTLLAGSYLLNKANMVNNGSLTTGTSFESQSSGSFTNASNGLLQVGTDFTNNSPFTNNGRIYLNSVTGTFLHKNGASLTNAGYIQVAGNFTNQGNINGAASAPTGAVRVAGVSTNTGYSFGGTGLLDFCDTTPGSAAKGFDSATAGSVGATVTACAVGPKPLPVTLTSFTATAAPSHVLLRWTTASEEHNAYFALERSADGQAFAAIGKVPGRGTSAAPTAYTFRDEQPLPGLSYYRLRQVDFDGTSTYSPVAMVQAVAAPLALLLAPNPATTEVQLDLRTWPTAPATLTIHTLAGQVLHTQAVPGGTQPTLDVQALPAGVYLLTVHGAGQQLTRRLLKQ